MPPPIIIDLDCVDTSKVIYDRAFIYERLPQSYEFELLDGICHFDREQGLSVGYHDCTTQEWWVRGHLPGRPIFPGILQLEAAAQLTAFSTRYVDGEQGFIVFGGVEGCRFRDVVVPPARYILICKVLEDRPRRVRSSCQGVVDGRLVFETQITGLALPSK